MIGGAEPATRADLTEMNVLEGGGVEAHGWLRMQQTDHRGVFSRNRHEQNGRNALPRRFDRARVFR
jgi:hypothetical protein